MRAIRLTICATALILCHANSAFSQLAVIDSFNGLLNTVTSIQAVANTANWILDLTGLDGVDIADTYGEDLATLGEIVQETRGLLADVSQISAQVQALFNLQTLPPTPSALNARLREIRAMQTQLYIYTLRTTALTQSTLSAIRHLTRLVARVGDLLGGNSGRQVLIQLEAKTAQSLSVIQAQQTAQLQSTAFDAMTEAFTESAMERIRFAFWNPGVAFSGGTP